MRLENHPRTLALACTGFAALSACASTPDEKDGLRQADGLVSHIEHIQVESELSMVKAHAALESLETIVRGEFTGESVLAFGDFIDAIERSEEQANALRYAVDPMNDAAEDVFTQWAENLEQFRSPDMRRVSQRRLGDTRDLFSNVVVAVEGARDAYDLFNLGLRDHALFLGHDFNATSVAAIEEEVKRLAIEAEELDATMAACMEAARSYVQSASLPRNMPSSGAATVARAKE